MSPDPQQFHVMTDTLLNIIGEYIPALPVATSENILMENFRTAYESMDFGTYRDMLLPGFLTFLQTATTAQFPDVLFQPASPWTYSGPNDVIPNARFALYAVVFLFDRGANSTLRVQGQIKFYVTSRDSLHNGVHQPYWSMSGQQDLTDSQIKPMESLTFGSLKALFR